MNSQEVHVVRTARLVLFFDSTNRRLVFAGRCAVPGHPAPDAVPLGLLSYDELDALLAAREPKEGEP